MTLKSASRSNIYNPLLPLSVVKQHATFEDTSFILSKVIIQKPASIKNKITASVILKIRLRSTIHHSTLASKVLTFLAVFLV